MNKPSVSTAQSTSGTSLVSAKQLLVASLPEGRQHLWFNVAAQRQQSHFQQL